MGFLDKSGLAILWQQIHANFMTRESGKGLSTNDYTTADKNRVAQLTDDYINALIDARMTNMPTAEEGSF
jgi:hypothetical protein